MLYQWVWLDCQLLFLLMVANGTPIVMKRMFADKGAWPVDAGWLLPLDGHPLLGKSKTWRGIVSSLLATGLGALVTGWSFDTQCHGAGTRPDSRVTFSALGDAE
jgi:hypothetical protein